MKTGMTRLALAMGLMACGGSSGGGTTDGGLRDSSTQTDSGATDSGPPGDSGPFTGDSGPSDAAIDARIEVEPPSFERDVYPLTMTHCADAQCHRGFFQGTATEVYDGMLANNRNGDQCASPTKWVTEGDASASLLYVKISGTDCGDQMPKGRPAMSASEIQMFSDWIEQGARP
jgi:hypothetical protein